MKRKWTILTSVLGSTLFLMTACNAEPASTVSEKVAVNVETTAVNEESLDAISSLSGKLEPYQETNVSFETGGAIQKMTASVGDRISSGAILASLNTTDLQLSVDQANTSVLSAEASLLSADAGINSAQAGIESANARINSAQASLASVEQGAREQEKTQAKIAVDKAVEYYNNLKTNLERTKSLYDQGAVSKKDYEDMQLQVNSAEKDVAQAQASYSLILEGATAEARAQAQATIAEAQAAKTQAEASLGQSQASKEQAQASYSSAQVGKEKAELQLSKARLTSPLTGVVLEKPVSEGEVINAGTTVYTLGTINQLKVLLPVPDKDIKDWAEGDQVSVTLYDEARTGTVSKIYPMTNEGTGTVSVEVVLPNDQMDWLPGQVVRANRITNDNTGILVPIEAVISSGADPYVFKVVKNKAVKTEVETGSLVDNKIQITKGLKQGDKVVTRGAELLLDGDPVNTDGGKSE